MYRVLWIGENGLGAECPHQLFDGKPWRVEVSKTMSEVYERLRKSKCSLIVSQGMLGHLNTNLIYKKLLDGGFLDKSKFVAIHPPDFDRGDLILGLELGIDKNFFLPIDRNEFLLRLECLAEEVHRHDLTKSQDFRSFIQDSHTPYCLVQEEDKIAFANDAFAEYMSFGVDRPEKVSFKDLLIPGLNDRDQQGFLKFREGLLPNLELNYVSPTGDKALGVRLFRGEKFTKGSFLVEIKNGKKPESESSNDMFGLSRRELEVANLSCIGLTIKEIADSLKLSPRTVERHRASIMGKTSSRNIVESLSKLNLVNN